MVESQMSVCMNGIRKRVNAQAIPAVHVSLLIWIVITQHLGTVMLKVQSVFRLGEAFVAHFFSSWDFKTKMMYTNHFIRL